MKTVEDSLNSVINHKVRLLYISKMESTLRETNGVVTNVSKEVITMKSTGEFGEWKPQYINRHSCVILSIQDLGEFKE